MLYNIPCAKFLNNNLCLGLLFKNVLFKKIIQMKTPELITSVEDKVLKVSIEKIYSSEEEAKK
jgi:hypothetical protein